MLKKAVTPGSFLKNYLFTLLIVFLPLFMFGVFGPSEIFFGNYSEFGFIYREFGWKFLGISVVLALFIALILQIVPKFPRTLILSVLWGFTIAGYIQTMFLKGSYLGKDMNNTSDEFVLPWLEAVKEIAPRQVMIYTIDRETPDHDLQKATHEELDRIVDLIKETGIPATASY